MGIIGRSINNINNGIIKPVYIPSIDYFPVSVSDGQIAIVTNELVSKTIFGVKLPTDTSVYENYTVFIPIISESENSSVNISNNDKLIFDLKFGQAKILIDSNWNDVDGYVYKDNNWIKFGYGGIDENTVLLLSFDNTANQDSSDYNLSGTITGSPELNTTYKKFGNSSAYFPAGAWIEYSDILPFSFGANDFTVDWWEYRNAAAPAGSGIAALYNLGWLVGYNRTASADSYLDFYASSNGSGWDICSAVPMGVVILNQWVHRAVVRKSGVFSFYQNGIQYNSYSNSTAAIYSGSSQVFRVGTWGPSPCICYVDEFRVSNVARWTQNFIPPNSAYTK